MNEKDEEKKKNRSGKSNRSLPLLVAKLALRFLDLLMPTDEPLIESDGNRSGFVPDLRRMATDLGLFKTCEGWQTIWVCKSDLAHSLCPHRR